MNLEKRSEKAKKLLRKGIIPGILFGKDIEPISLQLGEKELFELYKKYGTNTTFDVKIGAKKHIVYIKEVQRDYINRNKIIHFSLLKISKNDSLKAEVPLLFVGSENIIKQKLLFQEVMNKLEVEFPVGSGVNHIDVDVTNLKAEEALYARDVKLPKGYVLHTNEDEMIAQVTYPKVQQELENEEANQVEEESQSDKDKAE